MSGWNLSLEPFRFHMNCFHFRAAVFVHVSPAQLCTETGVSINMCSAVEVAWLAESIRHRSASVRLRLVVFRCL